MKRTIIISTLVSLWVFCTFSWGTPNYTKTVEHDLGGAGVDIESIQYTDGLGRGLQSMVKYNDKVMGKEWDIVSGSLFDEAGRPIVQVKTFGMERTAQSHLQYIEETKPYRLIDLANKYYGGGTAEYEIPYAHDKAYSEIEYYNDPLSRVYAQSTPGRDWAMGSGNEIYQWYFGTDKNGSNKVDAYGFLNKGQLRKSNLDNLDIGITNPKYFLQIIRSSDKEFTQTITDLFGNTVAVRNYNGNQSITASYEHDITGRVLTENPPQGNVDASTYRYNTLGQQIESYSPDSRTVKNYYNKAGALEYTVSAQDAHEDSCIYYLYDIFGRICEIRKIAIGDVGSISLENNDYGRLLIKKIYDDRDVLMTYLKQLDDDNTLRYDIGTVKKSHFKNTRGRLIGEIGFNEWQTNVVVDLFSYTNEGQVQNHIKQIPTLPDMLFNFYYDDHGRLITERILTNGSNGKVRNYYYDSQGRFVRLKGGEIFVRYDYYLTGELKEKKFGDQAFSNDKVSYTYSIRNWVETMNNGNFSTNLNYAVDGNISRASYDYGASISKTLGYSYGYDDINRLTSVTPTTTFSLPEGENQDNMIEQFAYDKNGRFTSKSRGKDNDKVTYDYGYVNGTNKVGNVTKDDKKEGVTIKKNYIINKNGAIVYDRDKRMSMKYDWRDLAVKYTFYHRDLTDAEMNSIYDSGTRKAGYGGNIEKDLKDIGLFPLSYVIMAYDVGGNRILKIEK